MFFIQLITAVRVRSATEGCVFTGVCLSSVNGGGGGDIPSPVSGPVQSPALGSPCPGCRGRGYSRPGLGVPLVLRGEGVPTVLAGGYPLSLARGTPPR